MASKYWLRLYHEMLDDAKVARLNDSAYRRFIECMLLAGEMDEGGLLPPLEDMAWRLRLSETALTQDMTRLALSGLVELIQHDNSERWFVSKFAERQAPLSAKERKRRQRENERKAEYNHKDVTKMSRKRDTDIDIDIDKDVYVYDAHAENNRAQLQETASTIACVVKTPYGPGINEDDFERAAAYVIKLQAVDDVAGFDDWWQRNTYYDDNGKAALKTFLSEFQNYLSGVERAKVKQSNGSTTDKNYTEGYHVAGAI